MRNTSLKHAFFRRQRNVRVAGWVAAALLSAASALAAEPSPSEVLAGLRLSMLAGGLRMDGALRHEGHRHEVELRAEPGRVVFTLPGLGERYVVEADESGSRLLHGGDGGALRPLGGGEASQPIAGSAISPADLAMDFLYWNKAETRPDEKLLGLPSRQIRVRAESRSAAYAAADLYVDKQSGALLQALCYDWDGRLVKRFKVTRGQRVDGRWTLAQMRVEMLNPESGKVARRSYLDFKPVAGEGEP